MATQKEPATCDVQFSLRVPSSMAEEIYAISAEEGMKPATWIRKIISKQILEIRNHTTPITRDALIHLIETDAEVQAALSRFAGVGGGSVSAMQEMEKRFERLRQVTEFHLDNLIARRDTMLPELLSLQGEIDTLLAEINTINSPKDAEEAARLSSAIKELSAKREKIAGVQEDVLCLKGEVDIVRAELMALTSETGHEKLVKKWDLKPEEIPALEAWQKDLEQLEQQENP